jgi:hypothetical protein
VKQLSSELKNTDKITYLKGIVDLPMETRILASLDHENIIKLEAVSVCDAFSEGYFIVLEKVSETLSKKVQGWMDIDRQCKASLACLQEVKARFSNCSPKGKQPSMIYLLE